MTLKTKEDRTICLSYKGVLEGMPQAYWMMLVIKHVLRQDPSFLQVKQTRASELFASNQQYLTSLRFFSCAKVIFRSERLEIDFQNFKVSEESLHEQIQEEGLSAFARSHNLPFDVVTSYSSKVYKVQKIVTEHTPDDHFFVLQCGTKVSMR